METNEIFYDEKRGSYRCDLRYRGVRIRLKSTTKKEILEALEVKKDEIDEKLDNGYSDENVKKTFLDTYYEYANTRFWEASTRRDNDGIVNFHFKRLNGMRIANITIADLNAVYTRILEQVRNGEFKEHHANKIIRLLKETMRYAIDFEYNKKNINLSRLMLLQDKSAKNEKMKNNYFEYSDMVMFLKATDSLPDNFFVKISKDVFLMMTAFLYFTGARINECRPITPNDFDRSDRGYYFVSINKQLDEKTNEVKAYLKNKELCRETPIKNEVYYYFMDTIKKLGVKKNDYIFLAKGATTPISRKSYTYLLHRVTRELKSRGLIPDYISDKWSCHVFRYSNTKYLIDLNVKVVEAAAAQGHTPSVMLNIYSRWDPNSYSTVFGGDDKEE